MIREELFEFWKWCGTYSGYHHTATAGFRRVRWSHCAHLQLYWYNGQY